MGGLHLPRSGSTDFYCDINGERYRAEEWGFVCLRLAQYFDDPTGYLSPADHWGDMGAASVPLFAVLTCPGRRTGVARGPAARSVGEFREGVSAVSPCSSPRVRSDGTQGHGNQRRDPSAEDAGHQGQPRDRQGDTMPNVCKMPGRRRRSSPRRCPTSPSRSSRRRATP